MNYLSTNFARIFKFAENNDTDKRGLVCAT